MAGVEVLALTDHDTTAGLEAAEHAADHTDLTLIPGLEISVTWGGRTVHIIGLRIDRRCAELEAGLERLLAYREWRAQEIGRRLARHGITDAYAGAKALSRGALVGRTHFARFIVEQGRARAVSEVFKAYLVRGKPGHVPSEWAALEEAVGWIRAAGGQAVVAHPGRYGFTRTKMRQLLGSFREMGGVGIEVISGSHSRDEAFVFARYAREEGLLASAGSDYHGPEEHWIDLGQLPLLPAGCRPIWLTWGQPVSAPRAAVLNM